MSLATADPEASGTPGGIPLSYGADTLQRELEDAIGELASTLNKDNVLRLFGKAVAREIAISQKRVEDRLLSPFSIIFLGDFKRGKSTLINALIAQAVAPVDVPPETISINRIEYAEEFTARLETTDGGQATLARQDLKRERLEPLLRRLPVPLRHLRVGVPVEILRNVTLIDTPGLGDAFKHFDPLVREYIEQSDTIVYVISVASPLSASEQDFLRETIAPRHFPKVFFVVNAIDLLATQEEQERVTAVISEKIQRLMPGAGLYSLSALDEWSRVSGGTRPNPSRADALASFFSPFRRDLEASIQFRRRYYVLDRAAFSFANTLNLISRRAAGLRDGLERNQEQLQAAVTAVEEQQRASATRFDAAAEELEEGFEKLRREAEIWMSEFIDRLMNESVAKLSTLPLSEVRQNWPFFLKDRLRRALDACLLAHEAEIAELFAKYTAGKGAELQDALATGRQVERAASVFEEHWSQLHTAELVAGILELGVIEAGISLFSHSYHERQSREFAEAFEQSLPQFREDARRFVRDAYTSVKNALVSQWTKSHQQELQHCLEDLRQAVHLRQASGQDLSQAQEILTDVLQCVADRKSFLNQFTPKVWFGISLPQNAAA